MSRKRARDIAFKCIYELQFDYTLDLDNLIDNNYDSENNEAREYIDKIVKGVVENLDEIDDIISSHSKTFTIDRISKINLAILRVAIYEIKYLDETPDKVAINEAVELAKTYGDEKSFSFVNGVLAKVIEK